LLGIFEGLFKAAMPLLKKGAKTLEREALKTGLKEEISNSWSVVKPDFRSG
jgi:hypothetical protein